MVKQKYKITESVHSNQNTSTYRLYKEETLLGFNYWKNLKKTCEKKEMEWWCLEFCAAHIEYAKIKI